MKTNKKILFATLATLCLSTATVGGVALSASAADTDPTVFKAVDGASVKIMNDKTDSGIRFTYLLSKAKYDTLVAKGGAPMEIPDFTCGKWVMRESKDVMPLGE